MKIVGLDFGTHQTKICIEDSTNVNQIMYEFLEFANGSSSTSLVLPSIVQINTDGKVSYGFVDPSKALFDENSATGTAKPIKAENPYPTLEALSPEPKYTPMPQEPKREKQVGYLAVLASLLAESTEHAGWRGRCRVVEQENKKLKQEWEEANNSIVIRNNEKLAVWESNQKRIDEEYNAAFKEWQELQQQKTPCRYRYFKQATFVNRSIWSNKKFSPETITIWYLTYIRFLLEQKLGTNEYPIRMGVPCAAKDVSKFAKRAYGLWCAAERLQERFKTMTSFLNAHYEELLEHAIYKNENYNEEGNFSVRTEAQAGLFSVVANQRITTPINFLCDIGGGTTDIGIFQITPSPNYKLKILETISIPKGLNYIFENYKNHNSRLTIEEIQDLFSKDKINDETIRQAIVDFITEVESVAHNLSIFLTRALRNNENYTQGNIINALRNDPTVYCGGGSLNENIRQFKILIQDPSNSSGTVRIFTDERLLNRDLIGIRNVRNKQIPNSLYTILSTSYGLALSDNWQSEEATSIMQEFGQPVEKVVTTVLPERNDDD